MPSSSKIAFITGITGQDGSYLAELLLDKGYAVHGLVHSASTPPGGHIDGIKARLHLHEGGLSDGVKISALFKEIQPTEIYNLAAQSNVKASFDNPLQTLEINTSGTVRLLEAMRAHCPTARFFQASSAELFGGHPCPATGYDENSPLLPKTPYGISKLAAYYFCVNYRRLYGLHISNGFLFNHESPRRGEEFVTRKVSRAAARIKLGLQKELTLGNLDAQRDWGYAPDTVRALWLMLQASAGDDFVVATGIAHSIQSLLQTAFDHVGLDWKTYVKTDAAFLRPTATPFAKDISFGNPAKIRQQLDWQPQTDFKSLIGQMVDHDLALAQKEKA